MISKRFTTEGVVLIRKNFSEADRILKIYTKHYGKLTVIAKGIRKPKSRKRGSLEVFSHIRFAASMGKNMDIMTEVEIVNSYETVRKSLKKIAVAYFILEVVDKLTQENERNLELFDYITGSLSELEESKSLKASKDNYVIGILAILGFWPKNKELENPDAFLETITERRLSTPRVGKKILA